MEPSPDRHQVPRPTSIRNPPAATSRASSTSFRRSDPHNCLDRRGVGQSRRLYRAHNSGIAGGHGRAVDGLPQTWQSVPRRRRTAGSSPIQSRVGIRRRSENDHHAMLRFRERWVPAKRPPRASAGYGYQPVVETRRRSWACRLRWRSRSSDGFGPAHRKSIDPRGEPSSLGLGDLATQGAVVIAALVARSAKPLAAACRVVSEPEWRGQAGTAAHGARAVQAFLVPVALRRQSGRRVVDAMHLPIAPACRRRARWAPGESPKTARRSWFPSRWERGGQRGLARAHTYPWRPSQRSEK